VCFWRESRAVNASAKGEEEVSLAHAPRINGGAAHERRSVGAHQLAADGPRRI
jgi:hypothetical protein